MIIARFEFHPDKMDQFAWNAEQSIVEIAYDNIFDLIQACQEFEDAIKDCTAIIDGEMINLQALSA